MVKSAPLSALAATALLGGAALAVEPPKLSIQSNAELSTPLPAPYVEASSDVARQTVDDTLARARNSGKRVLLDFGANWCPDCRILSGVMALPAVSAFVAEHYEVGIIEVGRKDKNLDLAQRFGVTLEGIPMLIILDDQGRVVNAGTTADLRNAREWTPQALVDYLARWAAPAP
jgi:thiol-disulfide isomerase/thioredoxin